jgi:hypothetical protein
MRPGQNGIQIARFGSNTSRVERERFAKQLRTAHDEGVSNTTVKSRWLPRTSLAERSMFFIAPFFFVFVSSRDERDGGMRSTARMVAREWRAHHDANGLAGNDAHVARE